MVKLFSRNIKLEYVGLSLVLLFAFFLRVFRLGTPSLWVDEATSAMASKMILLKGFPIFDSGLLYSRAYLFHYFQSFFLLFGQTDFLVRFSSVLFGIATIMLVYFIGREYSKSGGLISALFMSVFYLEVFYSRQSRFYQLFQLMFFLSIYFLYKSRDNSKFLYVALVSLFVAMNVQIAALVLAPFFVLHILYYSKRWRKYLSIIPAMPIFQKFVFAKKLSSGSSHLILNYFSRYASWTYNLVYMVVLFFPGVIWSYFKNKRLTLMIIFPSVVLLSGVFLLKNFAFRYAYFAVFPLILYFSLFFSFLYEKYGKIFLVVILILLVFPSNFVFPNTFVNILKPVNYSLYDSSAPTTAYKNLPLVLLSKLKNTNITLISYFSSDVEWYIRSPDYVLPFSMDGRGKDEISYNSSHGMVDIYSGAPILKFIPKGSYCLLADSFSVSKLKPSQLKFLRKLINGCDIPYKSRDLAVYCCS